jgi:hypothetical protein
VGCAVAVQGPQVPGLGVGLNVADDVALGVGVFVGGQRPQLVAVGVTVRDGV